MRKPRGKRLREKRPRGTGSIFQLKDSRNWWLKYYRNGAAVRESSETDSKRKAEKLLQKRFGEIVAGTWTGPKIGKIIMEELYPDVERDHRINARKSIDDLEARWRLHLAPFFGHLRTVQVTSTLIGQYVDQRQQAKAENGTVNRELSVLKRMFSLARRATPPKVVSVPYIAMLKETNVRTGFLDSQQQEKLASECAKIGLWMRAMFEVGVTYGWRHEEVLNLRVRQVDIAAGVIRLEPDTTKNDEGREVTLSLALRELLRECVRGKAANDFLFMRENGKPVGDFRGTWEKVCKAAGVPELLFHDLRRTAARNLRRAGVAEGVIMKIGGWKTRSVFERYVIVDQSDIASAVAKLENQQERDREEFGQFGQRMGRDKAETNDSRTALPLPAATS